MTLLKIEAWALLIFMLIKYVGIQQFTTLGTDFPKHYWAAIEILHNRSPYDGELYLGFNYPLFTGWIYIFLAPFSLETAGFLWDVCNTLYVLGALGLIIWYYRPTSAANVPSSPASQLRTRLAQHWPTVAAFAFAIYAPIFLEIRDGNIEPLNLFLLVALGAALLHNRDKTAGFLLTMLCLVKVLPVLFLPALFLTGKRRTVYSCLTILIAYYLVLLLTGWWRWEWFLFTKTLPNVGYHYRDLSNSLVAQMGFYFFPKIMHSPQAFSAATAAITLTILAAYSLVLLTAYIRTRPNHSSSSPHSSFLARTRALHCSSFFSPAGPEPVRPEPVEVVEGSLFPIPFSSSLAFTSLTIVLISPLLEYQHLIWAIPAYLFLILDFIEDRISPRFFTVCIALWVLIFACRYWTDLAMPLFMPPLHLATWLVAILWVLSGAQLIITNSKVFSDFTIRD